MKKSAECTRRGTTAWDSARPEPRIHAATSTKKQQKNEPIRNLAYRICTCTSKGLISEPGTTRLGPGHGAHVAQECTASKRKQEKTRTCEGRGKRSNCTILFVDLIAKMRQTCQARYTSRPLQWWPIWSHIVSKGSRFSRHDFESSQPFLLPKPLPPLLLFCDFRIVLCQIAASPDPGAMLQWMLVILAKGEWAGDVVISH